MPALRGAPPPLSAGPMGCGLGGAGGVAGRPAAAGGSGLAHAAHPISVGEGALGVVAGAGGARTPGEASPALLRSPMRLFEGFGGRTPRGLGGGSGYGAPTPASAPGAGGPPSLGGALGPASSVGRGLGGALGSTGGAHHPSHPSPGAPLWGGAPFPALGGLGRGGRAGGVLGSPDGAGPLDSPGIFAGDASGAGLGAGAPSLDSPVPAAAADAARRTPKSAPDPPPSAPPPPTTMAATALARPSPLGAAVPMSRAAASGPPGAPVAAAPQVLRDPLVVVGLGARGAAALRAAAAAERGGPGRRASSRERSREPPHPHHAAGLRPSMHLLGGLAVAVGSDGAAAGAGLGTGGVATGVGGPASETEYASTANLRAAGGLLLSPHGLAGTDARTGTAGATGGAAGPAEPPRVKPALSSSTAALAASAARLEARLGPAHPRVGTALLLLARAHLADARGDPVPSDDGGIGEALGATGPGAAAGPGDSAGRLPSGREDDDPANAAEDLASGGLSHPSPGGPGGADGADAPRAADAPLATPRARAASAEAALLCLFRGLDTMQGYAQAVRAPVSVQASRMFDSLRAAATEARAAATAEAERAEALAGR